MPLILGFFVLIAVAMVCDSFGNKPGCDILPQQQHEAKP